MMRNKKINMKKIIALLGLILLANNVFAVDIAPIFNGKEGCFILYNTTEKKVVTEYNPTHCKERASPDSTFKIALSLMAFDQNLITQDTVFKWNGEVNPYYPQWNQNQTPKTWLTYSVVWVSQQLTPQLGMEKIQHYLKIFDYGNQDFSGDPGKDNGLTHAWLSSSLKISPEEQLRFLERLVNETLPVSSEAKTNTIENMYLETTPQGWQLFGKTGSGMDYITNMPEGWFEGFIEKPDQTYIFVLNFTDIIPPQNNESAGAEARTMVQKILAGMDLY